MKLISKQAMLALTIGMAFRNEATEATGQSAPALTPEQLAAATEKANAEAAAKRVILVDTIKANFDNKVDVLEQSFHFRKVKEETPKLDEDGVPVLDEKGKPVMLVKETKRPSVHLPVPRPSVEGIVAILTDEGNEKSLELLLEAVNGVVLAQARDLINEDVNLNADNFPYEKLAFSFIANLPKAERRGGGISQETWTEWAADYMAIMPTAADKSPAKVELAAKVFLSKFAGNTTNKPVLKMLQGQLAIYATATQRGEEFADCIQFLDKKMETLLATDETNLLLNL